MLGVFFLFLLFCLLVYFMMQKGLPVSRQLLSPRKNKALPSLPKTQFIVQELCESRGGLPGLSVLTSLLVSVDVKNY